MNSKSGFTLIEVLTVVMIIGVIIGIIAFGLGGVRSSARDDRRKADMAELVSSLERFRADCGSYPTASEFNAVAAGGELRGNGSTPACRTTNVYISSKPADPDPARTYSYSQSGVTYALCASLENPPPTPPDVSSCASCSSSPGIYCNYILRNP